MKRFQHIDFTEYSLFPGLIYIYIVIFQAKTSVYKSAISPSHLCTVFMVSLYVAKRRNFELLQQIFLYKIIDEGNCMCPHI